MGSHQSSYQVNNQNTIISNSKNLDFKPSTSSALSQVNLFFVIGAAVGVFLLTALIVSVILNIYLCRRVKNGKKYNGRTNFQSGTTSRHNTKMDEHEHLQSSANV
uniref:NSP1-1 n=1 Tax=Rotavirus G pigeon/HK18 TaxID=1399970 RepID=U3QY86_9REOV|nr:NSP1-1 [Rotavirus G pigeon/HK18]